VTEAMLARHTKVKKSTGLRVQIVPSVSSFTPPGTDELTHARLLHLESSPTPA
jgi:hypothetical protein